MKTEELKTNKKTILYLILIILLGLGLRLISTEKPCGLWFDEISSYFYAAAKFPLGMIQWGMDKDANPPLYFILLHFWMKLFGENDTVLRLFSALIGTASIYVSFLLGKEIDNSKKTGLLTALSFSVCSLFIYYAQEVRFYTLFILLILLSYLFLLKVKNNNDKKNLIGLAIANAACMYTSTLGILFVFVETAIFSLYLFFKNKPALKPYLISKILVGIAYIPYLSIFLSQLNRPKVGFINLFEWGRFAPQNILYVIQDWFSPVLINLLNHPKNYYEYLLDNRIYILLGLFILLPIIISLTGIVRALKEKNDGVLLMFSIAVLIFVIEIILSIFGKFCIISRYTLISAVAMNTISIYGLSKFRSPKLSKILISTFISLNLIYLLVMSNSAPRLSREEGYGYVANILKQEKVKNKDIIINPYGSSLLSKYDNKNFNIADINLTMAYQGGIKKQLEKVFEPEMINKINSNNAHELLKPYLSEPTPSKPIQKYMDMQIFSKMQKGDRLFIVKSNGVAGLDNETIKYIVANNETYKRGSLLFLLMSKNTNDMLYYSYQKLKPLKIEKIGMWQIFIYEKN